MRSKGPPETPRGAGWGEQSHTACCEREWAGSYFNRNTDLRREERLENRDANSTSQEQHNCKYCLSRPRRQADHMHHVETFTKSVKFFFQALFLEVSLHYEVFHQRNVHFVGHLRAIISQNPPITLPPQNILPYFPSP